MGLSEFHHRIELNFYVSIFLFFHADRYHHEDVFDMDMKMKMTTVGSHGRWKIDDGFWLEILRRG